MSIFLPKLVFCAGKRSTAGWRIPIKTLRELEKCVKACRGWKKTDAVMLALDGYVKWLKKYRPDRLPACPKGKRRFVSYRLPTELLGELYRISADKDWPQQDIVTIALVTFNRANKNANKP